MKLTTATFLVFGFSAIAVFGFAAANHDNHSGCLVAAARGVDCPPAADMFSFLDFHLGALKEFSTAVFGERFLVVLLVFAVLLPAWLKVASGKRFLLPRLNTGSFFIRFQEWRASPFKAALTFWLALHENSPAFSR